jgi:hypothetical protein
VQVQVPVRAACVRAYASRANEPISPQCRSVAGRSNVCESFVCRERAAGGAWQVRMPSASAQSGSKCDLEGGMCDERGAERAVE